jgi:hypothetical protein
MVKYVVVQFENGAEKSVVEKIVKVCWSFSLIRRNRKIEILNRLPTFLMYESVPD